MTIIGGWTAGHCRNPRLVAGRWAFETDGRASITLRHLQRLCGIILRNGYPSLAAGHVPLTSYPSGSIRLPSNGQCLQHHNYRIRQARRRDGTLQSPVPAHTVGGLPDSQILSGINGDSCRQLFCGQCFLLTTLRPRSPPAVTDGPAHVSHEASRAELNVVGCQADWSCCGTVGIHAAGPPSKAGLPPRPLCEVIFGPPDGAAIVCRSRTS
ncbi:hypothetical protein LZ30DRAFT_254096 [Colletotrichum cereale]|nr:hypothetical protein LZ30DRAFT_254096 [Colletotrichum cereale]